MWYDPRITLSHNCLLNMVVGARSCGKTFNTLLYGVRKNIAAQDSGLLWEMAYVRRYRPEMKKSKLGFFSALRAEGYLDDVEAKVKGDIACIDNQPFCHLLTLSQSAGYKSVDYSNVRLVVFDEFLMDSSRSRYLPGEVEAFLELYVTIARNRDVPILMLANNITQTNPYYAYFNIVPNGQVFQKVKSSKGRADILLHTWYDAEQTQNRRESRFGQLVSGTAYGDYAIENEAWKDNDTFVEERDPKSSPLFMFTWEDNFYTVWTNFNKGKVWITKGEARNVQVCYAFTKEDQTPNLLLAKAFKQSYHFKVMKQAMSFGCLYYDTIGTKNDWYNVQHMVILL